MAQLFKDPASPKSIVERMKAYGIVGKTILGTLTGYGLLLFGRFDSGTNLRFRRVHGQERRLLYQLARSDSFPLQVHKRQKKTARLVDLLPNSLVQRKTYSRAELCNAKIRKFLDIMGVHSRATFGNHYPGSLYRGLNFTTDEFLARLREYGIIGDGVAGRIKAALLVYCGTFPYDQGRANGFEFFSVRDLAGNRGVQLRAVMYNKFTSEEV